jgi:hypothetical protein
VQGAQGEHWAASAQLRGALAHAPRPRPRSSPGLVLGLVRQQPVSLSPRSPDLRQPPGARPPSRQPGLRRFGRAPAPPLPVRAAQRVADGVRLPLRVKAKEPLGEPLGEPSGGRAAFVRLLTPQSG